MLYASISPSQLSINLLEGQSQDRFISWRILLSVLSGSHDEMIKQSWEMRKSYYTLKKALEPEASQELDPTVFNPLSQNTKVNLIREPMGDLL